MFNKVLVANRGEIALRVIRTLREMGIRSVAVYSEPDAEALHVESADEAVALGGAEPASCYLAVDKVVAAATESGAEAVHPGYGFLSESPTLPAALEKAGITFIGPPAEVLARVGDKRQARALMEGAGVPVIPGKSTIALEQGALETAAAELGFPVLIKAAAGGGGKGMRVVEEAAELAAAAEQASSEASAAFGDGTVYLEKYLRRPRHVEVQILADGQGNVVHLFDRECSLQRRHQKIVEESPCVALSEQMRAEMCKAAVTAARASSYQNAGTVEFLLDEQGERFYFLEVNARLQVEHPVTEMVTGLDLVRHQIEVAAGATLPFKQEDLSRRGHAIECRIYAEDPEAGFAPSPGRVLYLEAPTGPGIRHDEGLRAGFEVPLYYDPILCKLIVWAEDRPAAVARMARALREYVIVGVKTPVEMLADLLSTTDFREARTHTALVDEFLSSWKPSPQGDELALVAYGLRELGGGARAGTGRGSGGPAVIPSPWQRLGGWEVGR